jgi:ABC-type uncharacterized transport system auxiliary subunit
MIATVYARTGLASLLCALALTGCADKTIRLTYAPPSPSQTLGPRLIIGPFQDVRGNEGDHGDSYRVGGVYGGYGNRLAKVTSASPWPPALTSALVAEFRAQGVDAVAADSSPVPPAAYRLDGDVRNFSTEARWGREAHIGITVRLLAPDGQLLVDGKRIDVRESGYSLNNFNADILEELLNRAFAKFVREVAADPRQRHTSSRSIHAGSPPRHRGGIRDTRGCHNNHLPVRLLAE